MIYYYSFNFKYLAAFSIILIIVTTILELIMTKTINITETMELLDFRSFVSQEGIKKNILNVENKVTKIRSEFNEYSSP